MAPRLEAGWCWRRVADLLRKDGHLVFTPTLTGFGERVHLTRPDLTLEDFGTDLVNVITAEEPSPLFVADLFWLTAGTSCRSTYMPLGSLSDVPKSKAIISLSLNCMGSS